MADIRVRVRPEEYAQVEALAKSQNMPVSTFVRHEMLQRTQRGIHVLHLQIRAWFVEAEIMSLQDEKAAIERGITRTRAKLATRLSARARRDYEDELHDQEMELAQKTRRLAERQAEHQAILKNADPNG